MAAVTVAADNTRVAEATITLDSGTWGNDGGGGGVADEPDIVYQGTTSQSRKVGSSPIGRQYTHSGTVDMTAADTSHWLAKINATNYGALNTRATPAFYVKVGQSGAFHEFYLFGSDNYPAKGGWQIVPISPNVSGYRDVAGSPTLTAVDYWSLVGDFTGTSKSENLVIDAIDVGRGLKLTGGDGADPDGVFSDFVDFDEGTTGNRYGYVTSESGIIFALGELAIGEDASETAVATVFQDATGAVLVYGNGLVETGFHRLRFNLGNATTDIDITGATFDSTGQANNDADRGYTTTEDSRLVVEATGTSGALDLVGCTIKNTASVTLTSACTLDSCDVETADLTQSSAHIFDGVIRTTSAANVAVIDDPTFGTSTGLHDLEFIQTGAGHAIEITAAGTYDFQDLTFTGYNASDGQPDSAVYCSAGSGTITINVNGTGNAPSVRAPGMTINVVTGVRTVTVTASTNTGTAISSATVFLAATATTGVLPVDASVTIANSGTTATVTHTSHGLATGDKVNIEGASFIENNGVFTITVTGTNTYTYTMASAPGGDPIAYAAEGTVEDENNTVDLPTSALTVTTPPTWVDGDLGLFIANADGTTDLSTYDTGWTETVDYEPAAFATRNRLFFATADVASAASPPGTSMTWTPATDNRDCQMIMCRVTGADNSSPFDVTYVEGTHAADGNTAAPAWNSITTTTDGALVVAIVGFRNGAGPITGSPPAGWTKEFETTGSADKLIAVYTQVVSTAGVVSGETIATTASDRWSTVVLALKPEASNPTGTITSTFTFLFGATDVSGQITMSRSFTADQSVEGWARKSTTSPFYKQGPIVGTVSASGNTSFSAILTSDE